MGHSLDDIAFPRFLFSCGELVSGDPVDDAIVCLSEKKLPRIQQASAHAHDMRLLRLIEEGEAWGERWQHGKVMPRAFRRRYDYCL